MRKWTGLLALAALGTAILGSLAEAVAAPPPDAAGCNCTQRVSSLRHRDWNGVWVRIGGLSDPRAKHSADEPQPDPADESDWPPLTEAYRQKYRVIVQALSHGERLRDPTANCLPAGFPWMMNMPYPMEIHQTVSQVTIIAEWMSQTRRIYINARHAPDPDPTFFGDSIAHWEGNTLIADTIGLRSDTDMNDSGLMHGEHMHVIERWSQSADGVLHDELQVIDPDMLTKPWVRTFDYRREPTMRVLEYVCENNRDAVPAPANPAN